MTVIVGVLCQDGVILGADSSATFAAGQFVTIEQPTEKLFTVGADMVFAGTGDVGLVQRLGQVLERLRQDPDFFQKPRFDIACAISKATIEYFQFTHAPLNRLGALVAFRCADGFQLCEFGLNDLQPEFKTPRNWFSSMGSGQPITDPFLGLMRRVFFPVSQPKLSEAKFLVTWALEHAIDVNPGGIKGPIQLAELTPAGDGQPSARVLNKDELEEHSQNVENAEQYLAEYRRILSGPGETEPPPKFDG